MQSIIIFDVGGVLTPDIRKPMLQALLTEHYPDRDLASVFDVTTHSWQQFCCDSTYPETAFWHALIAATKLDETVESLHVRLRDWIRIYPETVALARRLQHNGYILGLLTNHARPWFEEVMNRFVLWSLFDPTLIVTSYNCGLMKPDPAMYRVLWECIRTRFPAFQRHRCIVIDDKPTNLQVARSLGMTTIHFRAASMSIVQLEQHLREHEQQ